MHAIFSEKRKEEREKRKKKERRRKGKEKKGKVLRRAMVQYIICNRTNMRLVPAFMFLLALTKSYSTAFHAHVDALFGKIISPIETPLLGPLIQLRWIVAFLSA